MRREPLGLERVARAAQVVEHVVEILPTKCGSMKRSCSAVPQRTSGWLIRLVPEPRDERAQQQLLRQAHARRAAASRRRGTRPAPGGPSAPSGRIELVDADLGAVRVAGDVDQQVAEHAVDEPGRDRAALAIADLREARSPARRASRARASSTRGAWLVGPMNRPENRYDSDGWFCQ